VDNKVGYAIIALLIVILTAVVLVFVVLQNQINDLDNQAPTPTPPPAISNTPSYPTPTYTNPTKPNSTPLKYSNVVYEWYLKPQYINNETWLNQSMSEVGPVSYYNTSLTWRQNYFDYLSRPIAYPEQAKDDPFVWHLLGRPVFIRAEFNYITGYTKAVYEYTEYQGVTMFYEIENYLPQMAVNGNWTKTYA
jgi:hypothetical protein